MSPSRPLRVRHPMSFDRPRPPLPSPVPPFPPPFPSVLLKRFWFNLALVCMGIELCLLLYLCIYLPYVKKVPDDVEWNVHCPRVIPAGAITGVVASLRCGFLRRRRRRSSGAAFVLCYA